MPLVSGALNVVAEAIAPTVDKNYEYIVVMVPGKEWPAFAELALDLPEETEIVQRQGNTIVFRSMHYEARTLARMLHAGRIASYQTDVPALDCE